MIKRIAIVILGIIVVVLGRGFFFYDGFYTPSPGETPGYQQIVVPPAPSTEFPESDDISDNVSDEEERTVLVDLAHENNFAVEELNVLMLQLISRDLNIKFLREEDDLKKELLGKEEEEEEPLPPEEEPPLDEEKPPLDEEEPPLDEEESPPEEEPSLDEEESPPEEEPPLDEEEEEEELPPDAFIIVAPQREFTEEEKETVEEFVDNGGKLLLIADPTRESYINNISLEFGLIFESDYLYNMIENEINYRNIFVSEFEENELTKKLEKIAFYVAGSVSSAEGGIAFVDENTFSSVIESRKRLSPLALAQEAKVLAVHDLTFMIEPYNGMLDNNQLIANIADWLAIPTEGEEEGEAESTEKG